MNLISKVLRYGPIARRSLFTCHPHEPYLPLLRKHSPAGNRRGRHLIAAYYSFIDLERMKGWVGLVGWPVAHGLPT